MGKYLEVAGTTQGKAQAILQGRLMVPAQPFRDQFEKFSKFEDPGAWEFAPEYHAEIVTELPLWDDIPEDKMLVVVVDNGHFEAVALMYDATEYKYLDNPSDRRPRTYILIDKDVALKAAC